MPFELTIIHLFYYDVIPHMKLEHSPLRIRLDGYHQNYRKQARTTTAAAAALILSTFDL
ncbi:MAG TPA: hypothetical protein VKA09_15865 [Nitrososphaeraceae archaeon]|nr:hypothetical protein [Nitrososphaeraceae archaeon]